MQPRSLLRSNVQVLAAGPDGLAVDHRLNPSDVPSTANVLRLTVAFMHVYRFLKDIPGSYRLLNMLRKGARSEL